MLLLLLHVVGYTIIVVVVLPVFHSGSLLGFLVCSALGMLAHLFIVIEDDRVRTIALGAGTLLILLLMVLGLLRLRDTLANAAG